MFRFPFTNFHELNLDWILEKVKTFSELIPPMETAVADVGQALTNANEALTKSTEALQNADISLNTANEAKEIAQEAAQGVIADGAVTAPKIASNAVTNPKILDGAITTEKIADNSVSPSKLVDGAVTTPKILNGAVTLEKLSEALQTVITGNIIKGTTTAIPAAGSSATYTLEGLTEDHAVIYWGFSGSPENSPPCNIRIITSLNSYTVTNIGGATAQSISPIFAKSYN